MSRAIVAAACAVGLWLHVFSGASPVAAQMPTRAPVVDTLEAGALRVRMLSRTYQELQEVGAIVSPDGVVQIADLTVQTVQRIEVFDPPTAQYVVPPLEAQRALDAFEVFTARLIMEGRQPDGIVRVQEGILSGVLGALCPLFPICD